MGWLLLLEVLLLDEGQRFYKVGQSTLYHNNPRGRMTKEGWMGFFGKPHARVPSTRGVMALE